MKIDMENNIYYEGIFIETSPVLRPSIRIAPMTNENLVAPQGGDVTKSLNYLSRRFGQYVLSTKGKRAISEVLEYYNLKSDDIVTILTTSNNLYISGCVTREIEKFCKWNREVCDKTKAIFFNHEFGYPNRKMEEIVQYGLPIIEDCAHTFFDEDPQIGQYSDFVIYSLPKAFPMQVGAVIKTKKDIPCKVDAPVQDNILRNFSFHVDAIEQIKQKRKENCKILLDGLKDLGVASYSDDEMATPAVFLFRWKEGLNYQDLKDFLQSNGVECSVFYGEPAFYMPCHQNLSSIEIEYMVKLIRYWYYYRN